MQFNTVLHRNLNLVILKNEMSVTRGELLSVGTAEEILDSMRACASSSAVSSSTLISVRQCPLARGHWVPRTCSLCLDLGRLSPGTQRCARQSGLPGATSLTRSLSTAPVHPTFPCFSSVIPSHPQPVSLSPSLVSVPHTPPHPHPRSPGFCDLFPQPCRPESRSHTGTLKLTPCRPRLKQSLAHCPLFHFSGHFPCPFLRIRLGLLPRSTFRSPRRPGPPCLISSSSRFGAESFSSSPTPNPPSVSSFPQWECARLLLVCSCLSALPDSLSLLRSPELVLALRTPRPAGQRPPPTPASLPRAPAGAPRSRLAQSRSFSAARSRARPPARPPLCSGVWWNLCWRHVTPHTESERREQRGMRAREERESERLSEKAGAQQKETASDD